MVISVLKKQLQEFTLADPSQQQIKVLSPSSLALRSLPVEEGARMYLMSIYDSLRGLDTK